MEVREGHPEDTDAICAVATATWHAVYDEILGPETVTERTADWYAPERVRGYFEAPDVAVFVAGDPVAGYAFSRRMDENLVRLTVIYVHPDRWGEGIGTALLERVERRARDAGADRLDLVVLAANEVGRSFYESHGHEQVRKPENQVGEARELVYEKAL